MQLQWIETRGIMPHLQKKYYGFFPSKIQEDILLKLTFNQKGLLVKKELIEHFLHPQHMLKHTTPIERSKKNDNYLMEILGNIDNVGEKN